MYKNLYWTVNSNAFEEAIERLSKLIEPCAIDERHHHV